MGCGLTNNIVGKTFWSCRYYYATHFMLVTLGFASAIEAPCVIIDYLNFLFFFIFFYLQRSIEDKLENLRQEKKNIEQEINRINPELQKVIL